jgi:hypothetical protein
MSSDTSTEHSIITPPEMGVVCYFVHKRGPLAYRHSAISALLFGQEENNMTKEYVQPTTHFEVLENCKVTDRTSPLYAHSHAYNFFRVVADGGKRWVLNTAALYTQQANPLGTALSYISGDIEVQYNDHYGKFSLVTYGLRTTPAMVVTPVINGYSNGSICFFLSDVSAVDFKLEYDSERRRRMTWTFTLNTGLILQVRAKDRQ